MLSRAIWVLECEVRCALCTALMCMASCLRSKVVATLLYSEAVRADCTCGRHVMRNTLLYLSLPGVNKPAKQPKIYRGAGALANALELAGRHPHSGRVLRVRDAQLLAVDVHEL